MTVVAKEKGVANGNYYLVGNFFNGEAHGAICSLEFLQSIFVQMGKYR